jgi:hypothetical protein
MAKLTLARDLGGYILCEGEVKWSKFDNWLVPNNDDYYLFEDDSTSDFEKVMGIELDIGEVCEVEIIVKKIGEIKTVERVE